MARINTTDKQAFKRVTDWVKNNIGERHKDQAKAYKLKTHEYDNYRRGTLIATDLVFKRIVEAYPSVKEQFFQDDTEDKQDGSMRIELIDSLKESKNLYREKANALESRLSSILASLQNEITERQKISIELARLVKENKEKDLKIKELEKVISELKNK